jgi:hypothetical protein
LDGFHIETVNPGHASNFKIDVSSPLNDEKTERCRGFTVPICTQISLLVISPIVHGHEWSASRIEVSTVHILERVRARLSVTEPVEVVTSMAALTIPRSVSTVNVRVVVRSL